MKRSTRILALGLALAGSGAWAQTQVSEAWIRGTVPQQQATGLFATLVSTQGGRLVAASSPVAGVVEIHEMVMDGSIMRMRAVPALELPPGQTVALEPGGYHVMLMELRRQLRPGDQVPVTLVIEGPGAARETLGLTVPVRALNAPAAVHKH